jgi:hypothetical protein
VKNQGFAKLASYNYSTQPGGMRERLKRAVLKTIRQSVRALLYVPYQPHDHVLTLDRDQGNVQGNIRQWLSPLTARSKKSLRARPK